MSEPIVPPIVKNNRKVETIPFTVFFATFGIIVPIFSLTVLPLSVAFQLGRFLCKYTLGRAFNGSRWNYNDSGFQVESEQRKPLKERTYDVVVLGATGFTGGLAVRHLIQTYGVNKGTVTWAIAGRSQKKLDGFKEELSNDLMDDSALKIPTIVVDTSKPSSMPNLVQNTRVVATTAGPYSLYGSSVVEFCAKFGTHYVDITGEIDWVKQMADRYQTTAEQTRAKIIPFCGHDSIPWDVMVMKLQDTLQEHCKDNLKSVEFWDEMKGGFAGGSMATLFAGTDGKLPSSPNTQPDFFKRSSCGSESTHKTIKKFPIVPEKVVSPWDQRKDSKCRWAIPFALAEANAKVVSWSRALRGTGLMTLTYSEKWVHSDFKTAATIYAIITMMMLVLLNPLTLALAKRKFTQPGDGPSIEAMEKKHYLQIAAEGVGEKGNRVEAMMYFPKDSGCMETARMLVEAALCLALESDSLPHNEGGFWSPSTGLGNTLVKRILDTGTTLDIRVIPNSK